MTRDILTSGKVILTVTLPPNFVTARRLLGEEWHDSYTYRIERVPSPEYGVTYFLSTLTDRPGKESTYVYTGVLHPRLGTVRLTNKSAFPAHATRYRTADHVLTAAFGGKATHSSDGWTVPPLFEGGDRWAVSGKAWPVKDRF